MLTIKKIIACPIAMYSSCNFNFMKSSEILKHKIDDRYRRQVKYIIRNRYEGYFWMDGKKSDILDKEISKEINAAFA